MFGCENAPKKHFWLFGYVATIFATFSLLLDTYIIEKKSLDKKKKKIVTSGGNWKPITSIKEMIGLMSFGRGVKCYNCK